MQFTNGHRIFPTCGFCDLFCKPQSMGKISIPSLLSHLISSSITAFLTSVPSFSSCLYHPVETFSLSQLVYQSPCASVSLLAWVQVHIHSDFSSHLKGPPSMFTSQYSSLTSGCLSFIHIYSRNELIFASDIIFLSVYVLVYMYCYSLAGMPFSSLFPLHHLLILKVQVASKFCSSRL